jgi:hypothetical protein
MEKARGTLLIGGRMGLRAGLDAVQKKKFLTVLELELRSLGHAALLVSY